MPGVAAMNQSAVVGIPAASRPLGKERTDGSGWLARMFPQPPPMSSARKPVSAQRQSMMTPNTKSVHATALKPEGMVKITQMIVTATMRTFRSMPVID